MARPRNLEAQSQDYSEQVNVGRDFIPPAPVVRAAPFTESFSTWVETKLSYPREVFKGDFYRITGGQEEHYKLLRNGWVDERAEDHPYKPWTSSPEALEVARQGLERLNEEKSKALAAKTPQVTQDHVAAMIEKAFSEKMSQ